MLTALHSGILPECRAVFKSVHIKKSGIYAASNACYNELLKVCECVVELKRVAHMP